MDLKCHQSINHSINQREAPPYGLGQGCWHRFGAGPHPSELNQLPPSQAAHISCLARQRHGLHGGHGARLACMRPDGSGSSQQACSAGGSHFLHVSHGAGLAPDGWQRAVDLVDVQGQRLQVGEGALRPPFLCTTHGCAHVGRRGEQARRIVSGQGMGERQRALGACWAWPSARDVS